MFGGRCRPRVDGKWTLLLHLAEDEETGLKAWLRDTTKENAASVLRGLIAVSGTLEPLLVCRRSLDVDVDVRRRVAGVA